MAGLCARDIFSHFLIAFFTNKPISFACYDCKIYSFVACERMPANKTPAKIFFHHPVFFPYLNEFPKGENRIASRAGYLIAV